jgi:hypothetical protein
MKLWLWIPPRPDDRAALDLDERLDPRLVADLAAIQVGKRGDGDGVAELDLVDQPVGRFVGRVRARHRRSSHDARGWAPGGCVPFRNAPAGPVPGTIARAQELRVADAPRNRSVTSGRLAVR